MPHTSALAKQAKAAAHTFQPFGAGVDGRKYVPPLPTPAPQPLGDPVGDFLEGDFLGVKNKWWLGGLGLLFAFKGALGRRR